MYWRSGMMIVSSDYSFAVVSCIKWMCFVCADLTCTFHQVWWWSIWSQLTIHSISAAFYLWDKNVLPSSQVPCMMTWLTRWTVFLILLFLICFLVKSPTLLICDLVASRWEPTMPYFNARRSERTWWNSWWPNFGLYLCEARAYQLRNFLVGHNWAWGLIMPGQDEFISWCFNDALWNPHLMSRGDIVEPT